MSNIEIWEALSADRDKLKFKTESLIPKISKLFKKEHKFPIWKWEEYEHQESRNKYLIVFYAQTQQDADKPKITHLAFIQDGKDKIVIQWGCWLYRKFGSSEAVATRYIGYYCGHFFKRYKERQLKNVNISFNDVLCRYFMNNSSTIPIKLNQDIQRNYKKYGELAAYAFKVPDGTCFIKNWNEGDEASITEKNSDFISVVLYYTFVNESMITDTQTIAINKETTKYLNNLFKSLYLH